LKKKVSEVGEREGTEKAEARRKEGGEKSRKGKMWNSKARFENLEPSLYLSYVRPIERADKQTQKIRFAHQ